MTDRSARSGRSFFSEAVGQTPLQSRPVDVSDSEAGGLTDGSGEAEFV